MARKEQRTKKFKELLGNPKWMENIEKKFDSRLKVAKASIDKSLQKASKSFNIGTQKDLNLINSKLRALEKRVEKLEKASSAKTTKVKTAKSKSRPSSKK